MSRQIEDDEIAQAVDDQQNEIQAPPERIVLQVPSQSGQPTLAQFQK
jgi:hypothetical protein